VIIQKKKKKKKKKKKRAILGAICGSLYRNYALGLVLDKALLIRRYSNSLLVGIYTI